MKRSASKKRLPGAALAGMASTLVMLFGFLVLGSWRTEDEKIPTRRRSAVQRRRALARRQETERRRGVQAPQGQVLALRLLDELSSARYRGPEPAPVYRSLHRHWRKMLDPFAELPADKVHLHLKVAFRNRDVANYLKEVGFSKEVRERLGSGERRWSRSDGVYESRAALFTPLVPKKRARRKPGGGSERREGRRGALRHDKTNRAVQAATGETERSGPASFVGEANPRGLPRGGSLEFQVTLPEQPVLDFGVAVIPRSGREQDPVCFVVTVESAEEEEVVWQQTLGPRRFLRWWPDELSLSRWEGRRVTLRFTVYGNAGGGFWMDPKVWGSGARRGDNLVVLLVDTLRPDGVKALGGEHAKTPYMDRLIKRGVRFTNFFSNGAFTRNSLISTFAANYPSSVGLEANRFAFRPGTKEKFYGLRPPLLPRHLERNGFQVFSAMNNFFSFPYVNVGVDLGFSNFTDVRHLHKDSAAITRAAIKFLRQNRNRRFFLFVHYETLHNYNKNTRRLARQFPLGEDAKVTPQWRAYLHLVREMDKEVGQVVDALQRLGLQRNTLLVLTSDHGEVFHPDHAHHVPYYNTNMLHQHARSIWDEVLRVPMVWVRPGRLPQDVEVEEVFRGVDVAPTLLDLMEVPPMRPVAGESLASLLPRLSPHGRGAARHGGGRSGRRAGANDGDEGREGDGEKEAPEVNRRQASETPVYAEGFHIKSLRMGRYKYIARDHATQVFVYRGRRYNRPEELFDVRADPHETRDISSRHPEIVARLRREMLRIQRQTAYTKLARKDPTKQVPKGAVYHLRVCAGARESQVKGRVLLKGKGSRFVLRGVRGDVKLAPLQGGRKGVRVSLQAKDGCVGFDWTPQPVCEARLELSRDGVALTGTDFRAGPFGVSLLKRPALSLSLASSLESPRPPAGLSASNPGVFVWQDPFRGAAWLDTESSQRAKASDEMVRMNLQQAGYVKNP